MNFCIDRQRASEAFRAYAANYDARSVTIAVKIAHTYRVAEIAEKIAVSIAEASADFAWMLGLLHDIGRFEQITRYGTLKDAVSVDHAELGADILFRDNLFDMFVPKEELDAGKLQRIKAVAENAVRLHNKLKLPDNLDAQTEMYTKILRDADKADIFRVLTEPPYDESSQNLLNLAVRDEVMRCVKEHRCVPRTSAAGQANELEVLIAQCCMAFEVEFEASRRIIAGQGYLKKLLGRDSPQLALVENEIVDA